MIIVLCGPMIDCHYNIPRRLHTSTATSSLQIILSSNRDRWTTFWRIETKYTRIGNDGRGMAGAEVRVCTEFRTFGRGKGTARRATMGTVPLWNDKSCGRPPSSSWSLKSAKYYCRAFDSSILKIFALVQKAVRTKIVCCTICAERNFKCVLYEIKTYAVTVLFNWVSSV